MPRDFKVYLEDILSEVTHIEECVKNLNFQSFTSDWIKVYAVTKCFENIGEAVKNLPEEIVFGISDVEWKKIAGMRNILAHQYFAIDDKVLWDTIFKELPVLKSVVEKLLSNL